MRIKRRILLKSLFNDICISTALAHLGENIKLRQLILAILQSIQNQCHDQKIFKS